MIPERKERDLVAAPAGDFPAGDLAPRHLRPIDNDRKGAKFAALDHDVARVLGPQRGAAVLYGFLASTWFEYADPAKLAERRKKFTPGDWVEVSYAQFMEIGGTRARASIIRWLRILAEECHPCPWSRCADEHPLIVVHRQGQSKSNRYRKWRCGEDTLVIRRRVKSEKLRAVARRRVAAGQTLNGIDAPTAASIEIEPSVDDGQLALLVDDGAHTPAVGLKSHDETSEMAQAELLEVSPLDFKKSHRGTPGSLVAELQEVSPLNALKSHSETSLRVNSLNRNTDSVECLSKNAATAEKGAAAIEEVTDKDVDDLESLAGEIEPTVLALARRSEPNYTREKAWEVSMTLASSVRAHLAADTAAVRRCLRAAIASRRLDGAHRNPLGFFIRGLRGERGTGVDRYLLEPDAVLAGGSGPSLPTPALASSVAPSVRTTKTGLPPGLEAELLRRLRDKDDCSIAWLRERNIQQWSLDAAKALVAEELAQEQSATPLANDLEARDPVLFRRRMLALIGLLDLKSPIPGLVMTLDRPLVAAQCRTKLDEMLRAGESFVELDAQCNVDSLSGEDVDAVRTISSPQLSDEEILNDPILRAEQARKERAAAQRAMSKGFRVSLETPDDSTDTPS